MSSLASTPRPLQTLVDERRDVLGAFLSREQDRLARACHDLARALSHGGTLLAWGEGAAATDAAHIAVEFLHPVIVGKRALPASTTDSSLVLARGGDVAVGLTHGPADAQLEGFLAEAHARGLLTLAFTGAGPAPVADHAFVVDSNDPRVVQEIQETAYHVLWELVHTFFEHPGLLEQTCITCGDVGIEARVVSLEGTTALVEHGTTREAVAVDLLGEVRPGEVVLCHAGVAIERLAAAAPAEPTGFLYPFLASQDMTSIQSSRTLAPPRAVRVQTLMRCDRSSILGP